METSLHRELKARYAGTPSQREVRLGRYRIDAVRDGLLIEVQHGGLAAIRDKIAALTRRHDVLVVKPIVSRKRIVRREAPGGPVTSRRWSPKRGTPLDLFHDLVHFTRVFPHRRLTVESLLVEVEEHRAPGHGRRRRWRRRDFIVEDRTLLRIVSQHRFASATDLLRLIPEVPSPFDTGQLAAALEVDRWVAQRIAYTLRETGAIRRAGKQGNALLYQRAPAKAAPSGRRTCPKRGAA